MGLHINPSAAKPACMYVTTCAIKLTHKDSPDVDRTEAVTTNGLLLACPTFLTESDSVQCTLLCATDVGCRKAGQLQKLARLCQTTTHSDSSFCVKRVYLS